MQLERFDAFVQELGSDHDLGIAIPGLEVYRYFDKKWFDKSGGVVDSKDLRSCLSAARRATKPRRDKKRAKICFPVPALDAIVMASVPRRFVSGRIQECSKRLAECVKHSADAFNANHDNLTGLLNKAGYQQKLHELAMAANTQSTPPADSAEKVQSTRSVSLLALDIDHFKQVNDSYGHPYGDVVLKCFARRIQEAADQLAQTHGNQAYFAVARPGGEEFAVVVGGALSTAVLQEVAEAFRKRIVDSPLPSQDEWEQMDAGLRSDINLPHVSERRVTVSVGLATAIFGEPVADIKRAIGDLQNRADTALYRAKGGGRNLVRDFSEILSGHGRVLEHHPDTGIVTIDIGSLVGVNFGQEFVVYHPDFSGAVPFVYSDGRTKKRLGDYPKIPCGRIIVFEVQNEISFCRVTQREGELRFPIGSVLEVVPTGSISHILPQDAGTGFGVPGALGGEDLVQAVRSVVDAGHKPFVAVFSILKLADVTKRRGQVFVNDAFAKLHQAIRDAFSADAKIGQTQPSEFAVVLRSSSKLATEALVRAAIAKAAQKCTGQVQFKAGVFDIAKDVKQKASWDKSAIELTAALDLARYAASEEAGIEKAGVQAFTSYLASAIVHASRTKGAFTKGVEDYKRLVECGVRNAHHENQGALCYFSKEGGADFENAVLAVKRAIELLPTNGTFRANLAFFEFYQNKPRDAYENFRAALEADKNFQLATVYQDAYALSAAVVARQIPMRDDVVEDARRALQRVLDDPTQRAAHEKVKSELALLEQHVHVMKSVKAASDSVLKLRDQKQ